MATRLTIRLDFEAGRRLGAGKVALLESIDRTGSISAAGRAQGMSYRRAWLLIDEMNTTFRQPVTTAQAGGAAGGGARLTEFGTHLAATYRAMEAAAAAGLAPYLDKLTAELVTPHSAGTAPS